MEQVAPADSSVLVRGETGTELAQAIHRLSPRGDHVVVKINCAALPSGLVESELFGREKGLGQDHDARDRRLKMATLDPVLAG